MGWHLYTKITFCAKENTFHFAKKKEHNPNPKDPNSMVEGWLGLVWENLGLVGHQLPRLEADLVVGLPPSRPIKVDTQTQPQRGPTNTMTT
jgi:hypothetical protein